MHLIQKDRECSIAAEAFFLELWRKRFQANNTVRTFSHTSGLDEKRKKSTITHNLTSVHNEIEPYVDAATSSAS